MGFPENAASARMWQVPQAARLSHLDFQPLPFHHQMMMGFVFLSPLKSPIALKSDAPTHQELGDHANGSWMFMALLTPRRF